MVKGLGVFRSHFKDHKDKYILIGGTACDIAMSQTGLSFRVTKDLDIVLIVEALDGGFSSCFWEFIKLGGYKNKQRSSDKKLFYRFYEPENEQYPYMIELFSRKPDILLIPPGCHLTPIPFEDESSSLSAILLEDTYYHFILSGAREDSGLRHLGAEHLIPLKGKAYLDLLKRKEDGHSVDSRDIRKHRNDVFRLAVLLSPGSSVELHETIANDLSQFLKFITQDTLDLRTLGIKTPSLQEIIDRLRNVYHLA